jgi:hypothetical protein
MTVTVTLPAPPEPYLETGLLLAELCACEELLFATDGEKANRLRDFSRTKVAPIADDNWPRPEFPHQLPEGQPNMIATSGTVHGTGRRRRVVAIGSGIGGLTAAKALKHSQANITDALVFLTRTTAQGTSHVVNQTPFWVQVIPGTAAVATIVGVLITLCVAVVRHLKKAAEERSHHDDMVSAARDSLCHGHLRRSRPLAKGWS